MSHKGSKHTIAVHRAAAELTSPVARDLLSRSTGEFGLDRLFLDSYGQVQYLNARTEPLKVPSKVALLSRAQERVRQVTEAPIALSSAWVEVSRRTALMATPKGVPARLRQIMLERLAVQRSEKLRQLRLLTRFTPGVHGMVLRCLERKARQEALFARARLERQEGRGNGRPRPRKRHWRRSWYSLIGC